MKNLFNLNRLFHRHVDANLMRLIILVVTLALTVLVGGAPEAGGGLQG